jgi:hypothetical protein
VRPAIKAKWQLNQQFTVTSLPSTEHPFKWGVRSLLLAAFLVGCSPGLPPEQRLLPVEGPRGVRAARPKVPKGLEREAARPPRPLGEAFAFHAGTALSVPLGVGRDGSVAVGTVDGYVHALRPDGAFRWSYTLNARVVNRPVVLDDGSVLVASAAHRLFLLRADGTLAWSRALPPPASEIVADPAFHLHYRSVDGALVTLSPRGGVVGFARPGRGPKLGPVAFEPGQAFVADPGGEVARLGPFGRVKKASIAPGIRAFTRVGSSLAVLAESSLVLLDRELSVTFRRDSVERVVCAGAGLVVVSGEQLSFVSEEGEVASVPAPPFPIATAACDRGTFVAIADEGGAIYSLAPAQPLVAVTPRSSALLSLDTSRSGLILAGYRDGRVAAYRAPKS